MKEKILSQLFKPKMKTRVMMIVVAHIVMGLGVALLKIVGLGTDPYSAMMLGLTNHTPLDYGTFCLIGNCVFFVIEILFGRKYIGIGTIANWFLLGYLVMFWSWVFDLVGIVCPTSFVLRVIICVVAIFILGFSLSFYQSADVGSSPYDCLPLIMVDRLHMPFFAARVALDAASLLVCFLAHGVLGLGTVLVMLFLGPIAGFINTHFSEKFVK